MHGDRSVSVKKMARVRETKTVAPCAPQVAERHSGYQVGGTSPFGMRKPLPVYAERTIFELDDFLYINGGRRGLLVRLRPADALALLQPTLVDVATS